MLYIQFTFSQIKYVLPSTQSSLGCQKSDTNIILVYITFSIDQNDSFKIIKLLIPNTKTLHNFKTHSNSEVGFQVELYNACVIFASKNRSCINSLSPEIVKFKLMLAIIF